MPWYRYGARLLEVESDSPAEELLRASGATEVDDPAPKKPAARARSTKAEVTPS